MTGLRKLYTLFSAPLTKSWYQVRPGNRILMYHRIDTLSSPDQLTVAPALFDQQIAWLVEHRKIVALSDLIQSLQQDNSHPLAVALTFDDGYLDNLVNALPVLEKYNAPATLYVTTEFAAQAQQHPRYPNQKKRLHLNWRELRELHAHPLIEIGSHTLTHPLLSNLNHAQSKSEISLSKNVIEDQLGSHINSFCYPSGNFTQREVNAARDAGYSNAVSVKPGVNRLNTDPLALKRTEITHRDNVANLQLKMEGAYDPLHRILDLKREKEFRKIRRES